MSEIIDENICRLCLNECFPTNNIFHDISTKGNLLYEVVNYVYNLEISPEDGLPPNICKPCLWKLMEFEIYKMNVHFAKKELMDIFRKNSVKKKIEDDGMIIAGQENGSDLITKTNTVLCNANMREDDTIANDVMDIPSEKLVIKSEIDIDEIAIPGGQLEIEKITEMGAIASLEHFNGMDFIQAVIENSESQELEVRRRLECHHSGEKRETKQEIAQHIVEAHNSIFNEDNNDKKHTCSICKKRFKQNNELTRHMRVHTGEKPFHCNLCTNRYAQSHNLKVHMRKHTGERPFQCNVCNYSCIQTGHLIHHMRKHTGEKPFHCNLCTHRYARSHNLKAHMQKHTGE